MKLRFGSSNLIFNNISHNENIDIKEDIHLSLQAPGNLLCKRYGFMFLKTFM